LGCETEPEKVAIRIGEMERDESSESEEEGGKRGATYNQLRSILNRITPVEELTTLLTSHKCFQVSSDLANPNRAKTHILCDLRRHLVRCTGPALLSFLIIYLNLKNSPFYYC
jgi:hypothetical protein